MCFKQKFTSTEHLIDKIEIKSIITITDELCVNKRTESGTIPDSVQ
ncbi:MAG: hypothetical protein K0S41_2486 [Anaerocolumna sp.]|nr:hypothetical protein [Anaerocolumna sp.]